MSWLQIAASSVTFLMLTSCGPTRVYTLKTSVPEHTPTIPVAAASATLTPYPTYSLPTDTPVPVASIIPEQTESGSSLTIQDAKAAEANLQNRDTPWLISDIIKNDREPASPDSPLSLSADINGRSLMWDNWWCAASEGLLSGNLAVMQFDYLINDEPLRAELGTTFSQHLQDGSVCSVTIFYITDLPHGTHNLEYSYSVTGNINDGYRVYGPGKYRKIYSITVDNNK